MNKMSNLGILVSQDLRGNLKRTAGITVTNEDCLGGLVKLACQQITPTSLSNLINYLQGLSRQFEFGQKCNSWKEQKQEKTL